MSPEIGPATPECTSPMYDVRVRIIRNENLKRKCDADMITAAKRVKAQVSFDTEYWVANNDLRRLKLERIMLRRQISKDSFVLDGGKEKDWETEAKVSQVRAKERAAETIFKYVRKHIERLQCQEAATAEGRGVHQLFIKLFTRLSTKQGGVGRSQGPRQGWQQKAFKETLIKVYRTRNPNKPRYHWDPVLSRWVHIETMRGAHIFPWGGGQCLMDAIFARNEDETEELFEPQNGLLLYEFTEEALENGVIALVPDLPHDASESMLEEWTKSDHKEYKVRVMDPTSEAAKREVPNITNPELTWVDLHDKKVEFRTAFRPRARYLYSAFVRSMLRLAWRAPKGQNPSDKKLGRQYWGTKGKWIKRSFLLSIAEELGDTTDEDSLLEAAADTDTDDENKRNDLAILLLAAQIGSEPRKSDWMDGDEESDAEEESDQGEEEESWDDE